MRTIIGKKALIALSVIVVALIAGVWAWQAGYMPEIGKFFAYEGGVPTPALRNLEPKKGPISTEVTLHGKNFSAGAVVRFGDGVITPDRLDEGTLRFTLSSEITSYCPPGAYCLLSMLPIQPGQKYNVSVVNPELCVVPTYPPGQEIADAPYDCTGAQSNKLTFEVTSGPVASCIPLPRCAYEGEPRCAVDPVPGTVFCPIPTPSCIQPPPCLNDREAPCAVRPAPGTVYCPTPTPIRTCMPRPACLDSTPQCLPPEPADGWCPSPTFGVHVDSPNGGETYRYNEAIRVNWDSKPLPPGYFFQLNLRSTDRSYGYQGYYHLGAEDRTFEFTQDLVEQLRRNVPPGADDFITEVFVMPEGDFVTPDTVKPLAMDESDRPFTILPAPTVTPTPMCTPVQCPNPPPGCFYEGSNDGCSCGSLICSSFPPPPGNYRGVMVSPGEPGAIPGGRETFIPLNMGYGFGPLPRDPYYVTGAKIVMRIVEGNASFTGYRNSTPLPELLDGPRIFDDGKSMEFSIGSGPDNSGFLIGNSPIGAVGIHPNVNSPRVCVAVDLLNTDVTARNHTGDVLDLGYLGGWSNQSCMDVGSGSVLPGDLDGDGDVDIFDYNIVVSNFGNQYPR